MIKVLGVLGIGVAFFILLLFLSQDANPTSGMYNFRRLYEKGILMTKKDPQERVAYLSQLEKARFEELEYVRKTSGKQYLILSSSLRFTTTAGELTNSIVSNTMENEAKTTVNTFNNQQKEINTWIGKYEGNEVSFLQDATNYLETYKKQLETLDR